MLTCLHGNHPSSHLDHAASEVIFELVRLMVKRNSICLTIMNSWL